MKKIPIKIIFLFLFIFLFSMFLLSSNNKIQSPNEIQNLSVEDFEIVFCPNQKCYDIYNDNFNLAKNKIECSFYDISQKNLLENLENISLNKDIEINLIIDNKNLKKIPKNFENKNLKIFSDTKRNTKYNNLIHNKFCVIDNQISIFGSANPTQNGFFKNNNNIILIKNKNISKLFSNEITNFKNGIFGYNKKSNKNLENKFSINIKNKNLSFEIETYFCPQDNCQNIISNYLNNSNENIYFSFFVLTNDLVESIFIEKSKNENFEIFGIIENRNKNSLGSQIFNLTKYFKIYLDKNKNSMHNKFLIIDKKIVITGSANPSKSGYKYNDEFIIVLKSENISKLYYNELKKLINLE